MIRPLFYSNPVSNMVVKHLFFVVLFVFVFSSCGERRSSYHDILSEAESTLESFPDSTVLMLGNVDNDKLSKSDHALYNFLTAAVKYKNDEKQSDSVITEAVKYYESTGNKERLLQTYYYIGSITEDNGEVLRAQDYYLKALDVGKESMNYHILGKTANHLGMLYTWQKMYEYAIPYLKLAVEYNQEAGNIRGQAYSLRDLGRTYSILYDESPDSAIYYYEKVLELSDGEMRHFVLSELGSLYRKKGDYEKAYVCLYEVLANEEDEHDRYSTYITYGALLLYTNKTDSARYYLEKAIESEDVRILKGAYYYLAIAEEKVGNKAMAADMYKLFWESRKKYEKELRTETIAQTENLYNYNRTQRELAEIKLEQLKHNMIMYIVAVILVLLCILSGFYMYKKNQEIKQQRERFQNWKDKYEIQRNEKELLEQITHSAIYRKFHDGRPWTPGAEEWGNLASVIDETYNNFTYNLKVLLPSITDMELKVCYLIKINLPPSRIAAILNTSMQTISMIRSRMYEKITDEKGSTSKFDNLISKL